MKKKILFLLICLTSLLTILSCKEKKNVSQEEKSQGIRITATFYPLYIMLENICAGSDAEISMLAPANTGCLHDYQLTTRDMQSINDSDVIVVNGGGMESFLDKIIESKKDRVIISGENITPIEINGQENPHFWVSVENAIIQVKTIGDHLASIDQKNAELYEKNTAGYTGRLTELKNKMESELAPYAGKKIITFHEAFPYFAREFNLEISGIIEREPGTSPSPKELNEIIDLVKSGNESSGAPLPLFAEPQYSNLSAQIIARETGSKIYELDPCVTGSLEADSYIKAMEKNLQVLKESL